jgi:adenine-specific DNA-methyltransferase
VACVPYEDAFIDGKLYFGTRSELDLVRSVSSVKDRKVTVKNGYATLADRVFINNLPPLSMYVIDVLKASTGEWKKCLFPYDADMNPVSMDTIRDTASDVYDYIMENESKLKSRSYDETSEGYWHLLGRSQGLNDTCKKKIAVNTMLRNESDIRLEEVPGGKGIYGGMYILGDVSISDVERALKDDKFVGYVKTLRKYKSGGYYTFSTKDLGRYLNYALSTDLRQ